MAPKLDVRPHPYPAPAKSASDQVHGDHINVTRLSFSDKILISITGREGKLAHWVHVPLTGVGAMDPALASPAVSGDSDSSLLPRVDLTATTVLGGTDRPAEVLVQTLATTVASAILHKRPTETRLLVLGSGITDIEQLGRDGLEQIIALVLSCL